MGDELNSLTDDFGCKSGQGNLCIFTVDRVIREVEVEAGLGEVSGRARLILRFIGEKSATGVSPRPSDVVEHRHFGTAPTIYASLRELVAAGWIASHIVDNDRRAKRFHLTERSKRMFSLMSARLRDR
jgi:DNA-binding MarR family transcriptional regulator